MSVSSGVSPAGTFHPPISIDLRHRRLGMIRGPLAEMFCWKMSLNDACGSAEDEDPFSCFARCWVVAAGSVVFPTTFTAELDIPPSGYWSKILVNEIEPFLEK
jgi:hypothetical protein